MLKFISNSISSFVVMSTSVITSQSSLAQTKTGEETILRFERNEKEAVFHVPSGGCTKKSDFGLMVLNSTPLTLKLIRIRPDHCKAHLPKGVAIRYNNKEIAALSFSHSKVSLESLVLVNTVETHPKTHSDPSVDVDIVVQQAPTHNSPQPRPVMKGLHRVSSSTIQIAK